MANTKVTANVIADNAVGITQLNVSDGTNGQVLTTNGSGTLSFSTISGYTDSDVETYLDTGTSTPTFADLNVVNTGGNAVVDVTASNTGLSRLNLGDSDGATRGGLKYDHSDDSLVIRTNGSDKVTIDSSGNVGIGTSSPTSYYSGADNLVVSQASGEGGITIVTANNTYGNLYFADGTSGADAYRGGIIYGHSANNMNFYTNGNERMRINSSGDTGIGTTSPTSKLHVDAGSYAGYAVDLVQGGSGGGNHGLRIVSGSASSYTAIFRANAATVFYVDGGGNYYFAGSNQSDFNKKENIADITDSALDLITQLQPKTYNFIGSDINKAGFIAQEMEQVIPRLVSGNEFDPTASDDVTTNPTGKGIDYMGYTAYLTKAVQEQQTIIDDLKARIETLENV